MLKLLFFTSILLSGVLHAQESQIMSSTAVKAAIAYSPVITDAIQLAKEEATWILGTAFYFDNGNTVTKVETEMGDFAVVTLDELESCGITIDGEFAGYVVHYEKVAEEQYLMVFDTDYMGYVAVFIQFL